MTDNGNEKARVLVNEAVLRLPPDMFDCLDNAYIMVAGQSSVRMTLAELALPGAQIIFTDFRQSASLCALHAAVQIAGGLDHMVLAADGRQSQEMFSVMCTILTLLPALRGRGGARIQLVVDDGAAVASLVTFLRRICPKLSLDRISVDVRILERRSLEFAA